MNITTKKAELRRLIARELDKLVRATEYQRANVRMSLDTEGAPFYVPSLGNVREAVARLTEAVAALDVLDEVAELA